MWRVRMNTVPNLSMICTQQCKGRGEGKAGMAYIVHVGKIFTIKIISAKFSNQKSTTIFY